MRVVAAALAAAALGAAAGRASADGGQSNEDLTYAMIKYEVKRANGTVDVLEQMSGVYALYSPGTSVRGRLVIANPLDGCTPTTPPPTAGTDSAFVVLARLDASSMCTPLQQAALAQQSGAAGVINMAPTRSSFIYLLEKARGEASDPNPTIPQVAVSGASGYRLLSAALSNPQATVEVSGPRADEEADGTLDLIVAVTCMMIAVLVLAYAFRVGRALCTQPPLLLMPEESIEDIEERHQNVKRLLTELPVEPYKKAEGADDACAVCLGEFESDEEVRILRCQHFFHVDCIDPWLLNKANCPLCKDNVLVGVEWLDGGGGEQANNDGNDGARSVHVGTAPAPVTDPAVIVNEAAQAGVALQQLGAGNNTLRQLGAPRSSMYLPPGTQLRISTSSLGTPSSKPALSEHSSASSLGHGHQHQHQHRATARHARCAAASHRGMSESELRGLLPTDDDVYDMASPTRTRNNDDAASTASGSGVTTGASEAGRYELAVTRNPLYYDTPEPLGGHHGAAAYAAADELGLERPHESSRQHESSARGGGASAVFRERLSDGIASGAAAHAATQELGPPPVPPSRLREQSNTQWAPQWDQPAPAQRRPGFPTTSSASTIKSMHSIV